ncbi:hypothetical protein [Parafrankia discariae]|uniref:hypothetical protein n=1 Tax=Parafrankia discariae TaxID=365528 RepID=UPI00039A5104|nr:hypothetical protein [Parafrankia discariae]
MAVERGHGGSLWADVFGWYGWAVGGRVGVHPAAAVPGTRVTSAHRRIVVSRV